MALTEERNERLTEMLAALKLELGSLNPSSKSFVEDQIKRHAQYDDKIFISEKQWAWVESLYERHAGGVKKARPLQDEDYGPDDDEDPPPRDEIPF